MKGRMRWVGGVLPLCVCAACFICGSAWGQATNSADVTGSVTDSSGAVVPEVNVTVQDLDKNTERALVTNASGLYDTGPLVPADRYMLVFKKEGFTTVQRGPMTLTAGVTGLNVQLTVGTSSQTVVVHDAAAPLLEMSTAEISQTSLREPSTPFHKPAGSRTGSPSLPSCRERAGTARTTITLEWEACRSTGACRFPMRCWTAPRPARP